MTRILRTLRFSLALLTLAIFLVGPAAPASSADDRQETQQLVERARLTVDSFAVDPHVGEPFRDLARRAKGIFLAPQVLRGAFLIGVAGGSGVFLTRGDQPGQWGGPAFHTIGEVSFGFQAGGEASEISLLVMSERGVAAFLTNNVKLGADVGVAVGPTGAGASAATANLSADIISYSRSKGLYAGVSLQGAVIATRPSWNTAYYGRDVTPPDILIRHAVTNPHAMPLIDAINRAAAR